MASASVAPDICTTLCRYRVKSDKEADEADLEETKAGTWRARIRFHGGSGGARRDHDHTGTSLCDLSLSWQSCPARLDLTVLGSLDKAHLRDGNRPSHASVRTISGPMTSMPHSVSAA